MKTTRCGEGRLHQTLSKNNSDFVTQVYLKLAITVYMVFLIVSVSELLQFKGKNTFCHFARMDKMIINHRMPMVDLGAYYVEASELPGHAS